MNRSQPDYESPYAPVALFVFNRIGHTQRTLEALQRNSLAPYTDLIVYSDGGRNADETKEVNKVRAYLRSVKGFRSFRLIDREKNYGLANNIIDGVTSILDSYGRIIVLEDDLVTSPFFLTYMNEALSLFADSEEVASIHGYVYPIVGLPPYFFLRGADCWGWATWTRAWKCFEPDGKKLLEALEQSPFRQYADFGGAAGYTQMLRDQIAGRNNSWAVRWYFSALLAGKFTLYPGTSFVQNIGIDGSGTHFSSGKAVDVYSGDMAHSYFGVSEIPVMENPDDRSKFEKYFKNIGFKSSSGSWGGRLKAFLGRIIRGRF